MRHKAPRPICTFLSISLISASASPSIAQDAAAAYRERYQLAGELLRAVALCAKGKQETKWWLDGLDVITGPELKTFSRSFPGRTKDWLKEGATALNDKVMADGIPGACAFAKEERDRALALAKTPATGNGKSAAHSQDDMPKEYEAKFKGTCKFKFLNRDSFIPCDSVVTFTNYQNHRSAFEFTADDGKGIFVFEGGRDEQPDLENYKLIIDKVKFGKLTGEEINGTQAQAEGDCHMHLNKDASKFYEITCDVFQRKSGIVVNFYLLDITDFDKR